MKNSGRLLGLPGTRKAASYLKFLKSFWELRRQCLNGNRFTLQWKDRQPCLKDDTDLTDFDAHYIYHPAWAARILALTKPEKHIDISSSLHFCSIVSAFVPIEFYDYRPAALELSGLHSASADLLALPFSTASVRSLSCMHVVEHVGLGRYGDLIDVDGDLKAIKELTRVLAEGGDLLFAVPIGRARIAFNAHRIYSYDQVLAYFQECELKEFTLIRDADKGGNLVTNATKSESDMQDYGCGCFWFKKKKTSKTAGETS